jgi:hypothetical protein
VFTISDRKELAAAGAKQIAESAEIEKHALPICRKQCSASQRAFAEVRAIIADTLTAVSEAQVHLSRLYSEQTDARKEARVRFEMSLHDMSADRDPVDSTVRNLIDMRTILAHALAELPKGQRRHRTARIDPVRRIDEALLRGFTRGHTMPFPPYLLRASSSPGSQFREVVGICYRAIGRNDDPERAIKAYIHWRKELDRESRVRLGIPVKVDSPRPARRKIGRQTKNR